MNARGRAPPAGRDDFIKSVKKNVEGLWFVVMCTK